MSFKDKHVLICGLSGMTGRNLAKYLIKQGADVVGFHHSDSFNLPCTSIQADLTDGKKTRQWFEKLPSQDYVFICCAKTYNAQVCKDSPESMILPNIQMVSNILEASYLTGAKKVVYMSSAVVYQPHDDFIAEHDADFNKDPYDIYMGVGWVKRYCEKLCQFYSHIKGLPVNVVRPTNIYGPQDKTDPKCCHVIPAFIMKALNEEDPLMVHSLGNGLKDFIYVNDLVRDMCEVAENYHGSDPINLCSGKIHSISEAISEIVDSIYGYEPLIKFSGKPDAVPFSGVSHKKFESVFGKKEYTPFKQGIKETVKWYSSLPQTPRS